MRVWVLVGAGVQVLPKEEGRGFKYGYAYGHGYGYRYGYRSGDRSGYGYGFGWRSQCGVLDCTVSGSFWS